MVDDVFERLLNKTEKQDNGCWLWTGGTNWVGFGLIRHEYKMKLVHRISYEKHYNTIVPHGLCVYHTCGVANCVNPDHLRVGTKFDVRRHSVERRKADPNIIPKQYAKHACTHCGTLASNSMLTRWHEDNCKHKPLA